MKKIISLAVTLLTGFASIGGGIADNIAYSGNNTTVQEQAYSDDTAYVQTAVNNTKVQPMNTVYTVSMPYCNVPECTIKEEHTHGACGVSGCMEVGEHTHSNDTGTHHSENKERHSGKKGHH